MKKKKTIYWEGKKLDIGHIYIDLVVGEGDVRSLDLDLGEYTAKDVANIGFQVEQLVANTVAMYKPHKKSIFEI